MSKQKYIIVSMRDNGGGTIVLHNLCCLLNELGQDAKIMYFQTKIQDDKRFLFIIKWFVYNLKISVKILLETLLGPKWVHGYFDNPFRKIRRKTTPFVGKNTIVIYYEGVFGNPLQAQKVIRWLLNHNAIYYKEKDKTIGYDKNDLFFAYREVFNDSILNPRCRILCTPYMDLEKYKRYNYGERNGKCYILRKGKWRVTEDDFKDGIVIDDLSEREKVRVFNECEYCISYDTQTMYTQIAALCGCISVVIPEKGKCRNDYRNKNDDFYGEAFGFSTDEIEYAISTTTMIEKQWKKMNDESKEQVKKFITVCEKHFNI